MIQEIYLKKAYNIKKEYLSIINDVNKYEELAKKLSESIKGKITDLNLLQEKITTGKIKSVDTAKSELIKIINQFEYEANDIDIVVKSLNTRIEKLKEEEIILYRDIKQTYPKLKDEEIKSEVGNYLKLKKLI